MKKLIRKIFRKLLGVDDELDTQLWLTLVRRIESLERTNEYLLKENSIRFKQIECAHERLDRIKGKGVI